MSQSGNQDLPNMMWQDEEAFRRQLHMQQLHQQQRHHQQHQHQHQSQHPHNLHFQHVPTAGNDHHQEVHNANSLYMGGPLQQQQQQQQSHPQQAPPNAAPSTGAEHMYSMLPMGNGSYLKVYHNQDDTMKFQNYELFSSNSFIQIPQQLSAAQLGNTSHVGLHNHPQTSTMYPSQQQQQMFLDQSTPAAVPPPTQQQNDNNTNNNNNNNNMFINQLAENWVPNISGTYSPFGEPQHQPLMQMRPPCDNIVPEQQFQPSLLCGSPIITHQQIPTAAMMDNIITPLQTLASPQQPQVMSVNSNIDPSHPPSNVVDGISLQPTHQSSGTNGSFLQMQHEEYSAAAKKATPAPKKPRMVAEVKPMRKTYADVVSKNVLLTKTDEASVISAAVAAGTSIPVTEAVVGGGPKTNSASKVSKDNKGKQQHSSQTQDNKRSSYDDRSSQKNGTTAHLKDAAKGPTAKLQQSSSGNPTTAEDRNKSPDNENRTFMATRIKRNATQSSATSKTPSNKTKPTSHSGESAKKKSSPASASDQELEDDSASSASKSSSSNGCFLYNICKNESTASSKANSSARKSAQSKPSSVAGTGSSSTPSTSTGGPATRASASKSERFSAYLHRRQQRSSRQKSGYDLILKMVEKWLELALRFVLWLFDLVSDVVILSGSMLWDGSKFVFEYSKHLYEVARKELRQNSGKPTAMCKAWLLRFDKQFGVDSRWAVWRRFVKKHAQPTEQVRSGRLPTTGDEAMYSLLNCKGKDAYSILGVAADCSQEQLRKHYKKIAVLVHPDKNKQAGAEEAFKILQRAFELIGEPEARAAYDQSLAEALNAEKACSEINELLTQLQSKFAEAANTIRCSSCGQRHPRRPTGRPHFAARECSSCKIRHPAREGDIWAETTFFGLRWKYLALMEGKVFDITEWANCQKGALSHLQPNSHIVQYRIVLGNQQQPNQQQQQQQSQQQQQANAGDRIGGKHANSEPSLDEFLDNLYSGQNPMGQSQPSGRRRGGRKN